MSLKGTKCRGRTVGGNPCQRSSGENGYCYQHSATTTQRKSVFSRISTPPLRRDEKNSLDRELDRLRAITSSLIKENKTLKRSSPFDQTGQLMSEVNQLRERNEFLKSELERKCAIWQEHKDSWEFQKKEFQEELSRKRGYDEEFVCRLMHPRQHRCHFMDKCRNEKCGYFHSYEKCVDGFDCQYVPKRLMRSWRRG